MDDETFINALKGAKIPILVLDQKWHRLFALNGKPDEVKEAEVALNELLAEQGKLNNEAKELKKVKNKLMKGIVDNMEGTEVENVASDASHTLAQNKALIDDTNQKIDAINDRLLEIPNEIKLKNNELMLITMKFAYEKMRTNTKEVNEIADWIKQVRIDLKKNIIRKQNREINNREIYSYMNDIFGKDVVNIFDLKDGEDIALISEDSGGAMAVNTGSKDSARDQNGDKAKPADTDQAAQSQEASSRTDKKENIKAK